VARLSADHRREQLIDVAIELFSRKGFNGTTTREIALTAGVTEAVIFRHFATKEQLYTAIIDRKMKSPALEGWIAELRAAMDANDDEALVRSLIHGIIATHQIDPNFERLMLYAALERNEIALLYMRQVTECVITEFRTYFARRQRQGVFAKMPPDAALTAVIGMAFHYSQKTYIHGIHDSKFTDEEAQEAFTRIALSGLRKKSISAKEKKK
jgi:TetR/AcrR family transcriptional regulator